MRRILIAAMALGLLVACGSNTKDAEPGEPIQATRDGEASAATATAPPDKPPTAVDPAGLYLSAPLSFPEGEPGEISIVAMGTPEVTVMGSMIPVVVRNNTTDTVHFIDVNMTARGPDGALVGSGSTGLGFQPGVLHPGEWAFGSVVFTVQLPPDAVFESRIEGRTDTIMDPVQLVVTEATAASPPFGDGLEITVVVQNPSDRSISLAGGDVGCFTPESVPLPANSIAVISETIPAGGSVSASATVFDSCPVWAIGFTSTL